MPSGNRNGKSVKIYARIPHSLARAIEENVEVSETITAFIVAAIESEISRREKQVLLENGISQPGFL